MDTGLLSPIGERLRRVRHLLADEPMFMANYADVLTDAPLPDMIERFTASEAVASLLAVPPQSSHHAVDIGDDGVVTGVTPMRDLNHWENGGYFLFRPEIFDELNEDEDLVEDALVRLVRRGRVMAYQYKGYWSPADTVKERIHLDERYHRSDCPWMIWDPERSGLPARSFDGSPLPIQSKGYTRPPSRGALTSNHASSELSSCPRTGLCRSWRSAPIPMTSRSGREVPCSRLRRAGRG